MELLWYLHKYISSLGKHVGLRNHFTAITDKEPIALRKCHCGKGEQQWGETGFSSNIYVYYIYNITQMVRLYHVIVINPSLGKDELSIWIDLCHRSGRAYTHSCENCDTIITSYLCMTPGTPHGPRYHQHTTLITLHGTITHITQDRLPLVPQANTSHPHHIPPTAPCKIASVEWQESVRPVVASSSVIPNYLTVYPRERRVAQNAGNTWSSTSMFDTGAD